MSCKYCSNDFLGFELDVGTCDAASVAFIGRRYGKVSLGLVICGHDNQEVDSIEINYCPWCGTKLMQRGDIYQDE